MRVIAVPSQTRAFDWPRSRPYARREPGVKVDNPTAREDEMWRFFHLEYVKT
jgi:hypothetical protein